MKKSAIAKRRAAAEFKEAEAIRKRMDALQMLAGCKTQAQFAIVLDMPLRRLRYIRQHPEKCSLKEALYIQTLAKQYDAMVFNIDTEKHS